MTVMLLGYVIHSYLSKAHWCETDSTGEDGIRNFKIRCKGPVNAGDLILRWSDDGERKTLWRVLSASPIDKQHVAGRMEDIFYKQEAIPQRLMGALKGAEMVS